MSWTTYEQAHREGVEETEEKIDRRWALVLLLLLRSERRITDALRPRALALPVLPNGRFQTASRGRSVPAVRRFRAFAQRLADYERRDLLGHMGGGGLSGARPKLPGTDGGNRGATSGLLREGLDAVRDAHEDAWRRMRLIHDEDAAAIQPVPGIEWKPKPPGKQKPEDIPEGLPGDTEVMPGVTLDDYEEAVKRAAEEMESAGGGSGAAEDLYDMAADQARNVLRNIEHKTGRIAEEIVRITGKHGRPADLLSYLDQRHDTWRAARDAELREGIGPRSDAFDLEVNGLFNRITGRRRQ